MKIKRIYWALSIVLLWIICAFSFNYFYTEEKKAKIEEITANQHVNARLASKNFEQLFLKWNNVLYYLSNDSNIKYMNDAGKNDMAKLLHFFDNEIKGLTRTSNTGKIIFTLPTYQNSIGADISGQKHMKEILSHHRPVVSDVFNTIQGYKAVVIHFPVYKKGLFDGTVAILLDFEKISNDILSEIKIGKLGFVWLLSSEGIELFCNHPEHIGKKIDPSHKGLQSVVDSMLMAKNVNSRFTIPSYNQAKSHYFVYSQPIRINNTFWSLTIAYSEKEITASLVNFRNRLIAILIFIFLGGSLLSYYGIKAWIIVKDSDLRDIAEKKLKESEERYRVVIETTNTGYAVLDDEGKIIYSNQLFSSMAGYSKAKEIEGKTFESWSSPEDHRRFLVMVKNCCNENTAQKIEIDFIHKNGEIIPVEINASKIQTNHGLNILMICRNISESRQAKEKLIKEQTLLRTLIDNLPSGVFIKDAAYRKIIANSIHIKSVLGHLRRTGKNTNIDIIGKTDFEVFSPEEASAFLLDDSKVIETGQAIINQVEPGWGPNNEKIWLLVSKVPLKTEDGTIMGMVGITTDITDQKNIEEQLTLAKEKAEQSDRLKTAFLNNISHEIRTPLNAITGFSGLLKEPGLTDEKRNHFIEIISQSSNQLLLIITDIINIATIEAGQIKLIPGKVAINSILSILYEQYKGTANSKNLLFSYSATLSDTDSIIETDGTKFTEILSNLINNALKFTRKGSVQFGYHLEQKTLVFYVEDTGIGIKPEHHQAIFERFWQVESQLTNRYGGTGLGLSISKTYVDLLGGKIWLNSVPGVGTTFYFTLPYKR